MSKPIDVNTLLVNGKLPQDPFEEVFLEDLIPDPPESEEDSAPVDDGMDMSTALKRTLEMVMARLESGNELNGYTADLPRLDKILDGWQRGLLYVLAGRTGMGKSVVALNSALRLAKNGAGVVYFTFEMPILQQAQRAMFAWGHVSSNRWKEGLLRDNDFASLMKAIQEMSKFSWYWYYRRMTVEKIQEELRRCAKRMKAKDKQLGVAVVDHTLLVEPTNMRQQKREQIVHITQSLKRIAVEENVCMIALDQISRVVEGRGVKNKRPQMSDLKESGTFEEDADVVMLLYRDDYYQQERSRYTNILEINVPKVRDGQPGYTKLRFDGACHRIDPLTDREEEEGQ